MSKTGKRHDDVRSGHEAGWIRRLSVYCWRFKRDVIISLGGSILYTATALLIPLLQRSIIDNVIVTHRDSVWPLAIALAAVLVAVIYFVLYRTQFGRSVRATMQDETAARLVGIDTNRVAAITFGIGIGVTAAGGMVYGATSGGFNPNSGYDLISRLLAIIILGGLGSIGGALVASVFMLTVVSLVDVWSPNWANAVFYAALVLVLLIRPTGFFGRQVVRAE